VIVSLSPFEKFTVYSLFPSAKVTTVPSSSPSTLYVTPLYVFINVPISYVLTKFSTRSLVFDRLYVKLSTLIFEYTTPGASHVSICVNPNATSFSAFKIAPISALKSFCFAVFSPVFALKISSFV